MLCQNSIAEIELLAFSCLNEEIQSVEFLDELSHENSVGFERIQLGGFFEYEDDYYLQVLRKKTTVEPGFPESIQVSEVRFRFNENKFKLKEFVDQEELD